MSRTPTTPDTWPCPYCGRVELPEGEPGDVCPSCNMTQREASAHYAEHEAGCNGDEPTQEPAHAK